MRYFFLFAVLLILLLSCNQEGKENIKIAGKAQGTTWHITYFSKSKKIFTKEIDSLLKAIDTSLSTYLSVSIISRINKNDSSVLADNYFLDVFNKSREISEKTRGFFDVTVGPLINAWGFGFTKKAKVDSAMIDSLLNFAGYKMVRLEGKKLIKEKPQTMLDFNAIAQGYTVDVLAAYLESKGIMNYLVELGGEVKARGKKNKNINWTVGIDQPNEMPTDERPLKAIIKLNNRALATSGNYRKFYIEDGKKYAHIIDPYTGYPAKHNLLSTTVLAGDCMTADAYATAFMVMGLERSKQFLAANKELQLEVFFISDENGFWKTYTSETLKEWIEEIE
jgi:thiamine biosynthesis lipoprotein